MLANDGRRRRIAASFMCLVCLLLAAPGARAAAATFPSDIGAGTLLFRAESGFDAAAPLSTDLRVAVTGVVARVTIAQRFRNSGSEWAEAVYAFPLPDGAAVDRLTMRIGERLVEGEIREKEQAERLYSQARDAGRRASLVTQTTPNLFTTAVANIAPGESIDVTIEYLDTARYDAGEFSLRFPMTLTPRYESATPVSAGTAKITATGGAVPAMHPPGPRASSASGRLAAGHGNASPQPVTTAMATSAVNEAAVHVTLAPGMPLDDVISRHHDVRVLNHDSRYEIETASPTVAMDRDFVIAWRPRAGAAPTVAALTETVGDTAYALLMILPPADTQAFRSQPREVLYVVDTSGSMAGAPLEQARLALADALGRLSGGDRFNVFQFNSTTSSLYRLPTPWTAESHAEALRYVERLEADGGTEMGPAIRAALSQPTTPGYLRQVVFLTDGGVANETALFATIRRQLADARLFTVGIGAAPNSYFMRKAAEFGRGTYTHIGDAGAVATTMDALFAKLERVALTDVLVSWPDAVEYYPPRVPDLYAGEPVVVAGSLDAQSGKDVSVEVFGRIAGAPWSKTVTAAAASSPGIAALWARRRIEHLIDGRVDGVDANVIRRAVTDTALEHGLVSPYTSLVAVDRTPARSRAAALERRAVGSMPPAGTPLAHLPQTSTPAALLRWLGMLVLATAALPWWPALVRR